MKGRFRLPMTEDRAYAYLLAAYIAEVQFRHREFISNSSVEEQLRQIAKCLTEETSKFGIVLCVDVATERPLCSKHCKTSSDG